LKRRGAASEETAGTSAGGSLKNGDFFAQNGVVMSIAETYRAAIQTEIIA
jgi:hypothetical protein